MATGRIRVTYSPERYRTMSRRKVVVREPATRRVARWEKTKKISGRTSIWSAVSTCWIGAPVLAWADVVGGAQTVFAATLFGAGVGTAAISAGVYGFARWSANKRDRLTVGEIVVAPAKLREPLLEALTAAHTIRDSTAHQEGWLTDIDLDAAVWDIAQHVRAAFELVRDLPQRDSTDAGEDRFKDSWAALDQCVDRVRAGADRLTALATKVEDLDEQLAQPARRAALDEARARAETAEAERLNRLAQARAKLEAIDPAADTVADQLAGQLAAYAELPIDVEQDGPQAIRNRS
ncbi:hypothetical protein GS894_23930 [Rhodococcus hoagii]|uniref:hypothetical protein n=1 Tax=Rhodococcus hoagii TaxID=43767 RepID=UPI0007CD9C38|nr:hypothetical protein [Prescottella equi]NKS85585.1 hypothetical protein [Prescottella equi]NKT12001.1 hypothetical protein [Prescottella equi]NKT16215.1 hypothetical protein [Prescottella equi]NKT36032.1 hypothetical protein [Prescottella equi]NKT37676.1 hypothetical protein [Prescottella equi]